MKKVKEMPTFTRPREKLQEKGPKALSDKELLAILLGSGTQAQDVLTLAGRILKILDDTSASPTLEQLQSIDGIGPAKATTILAALEFARRRIRPEGFKIGLPPDVLPLIQHVADRKQEHFLCISLNGAHEVIAVRTVSVGLVNKTQVHPREVFADPLTDRATAVIVAHNHPTGNLKPSKDDIAITRQLKSAGETLGIRLLDHIIFSHKGYYSLLENHELERY
ncbi:MAG: DNA repair protein RadC [Deltaproteobacteria bacterium]|nr:DNA repair protein RadC [Deltaproteobacteria bacterium]